MCICRLNQWHKHLYYNGSLWSSLASYQQSIPAVQHQQYWIMWTEVQQRKNAFSLGVLSSSFLSSGFDVILPLFIFIFSGEKVFSVDKNCSHITWTQYFGWHDLTLLDLTADFQHQPMRKLTLSQQTNKQNKLMTFSPDSYCLTFKKTS